MEAALQGPESAMKRILLGAVGLAGFALASLGAAPAFAADLGTYTKAPAMVPLAYDWTGFYVGINGGGGFSHTCWTNTNTVGIPTVPGFGEGCHDANGGVVGGQIGYRWQSANWVFGAEGQGNWADMRGSNLSLASTPIFNLGVTNQSKIDAIGLITGQVGYAWNNVLWYVKGGAAVTGNTYNGFVAATGALLDRASNSRWGGAIGTGVEVGFAQNWTVAVEYDHLFMNTNSQNFTTPAGVFTRTDNIKQDVDLATVRVNYRWGGPVIGKY
jgi:outer membrane immunogenic protein